MFKLDLEKAEERKKEGKKESEVAQLCLTLCEPMDCSPPGSSIHVQPSSALGSLHLLFLLPGIIAPRFSARLLPHYLSELCSENRLIDTAGAGEGG